MNNAASPVMDMSSEEVLPITPGIRDSHVSFEATLIAESANKVDATSSAAPLDTSINVQGNEPGELSSFPLIESTSVAIAEEVCSFLYYKKVN